MAFSDLPIELVQHIALELDTDKDICSFAATCALSRNAIYRDGDSFWFQRFKIVYDPVRYANRMKSNRKYKDLYLKRHRHMAVTLSAKQMSRVGHDKKRFQKPWVNMLTEMIEDAVPSLERDDGQILSKNALIVAKHAFESGLMNDIFRFEKNDKGDFRLKTVQLLLSHLMFELFGPDQIPRIDTHNFAESQKVVYSSDSGAERSPVFWDSGKQQANIDFALHCVNFFKHHLTRESEHTGYPEYSALPDDKRPPQWQPQAEEDVGKLGRKWVGTYTYLEHRELRAIRRHPKRDEMFFQDKHIDEGHHVLQNMEVDFVQNEEDHFYPELFDMILNPNKYPNGQAQHRPKPISCGDQKFRFTGFGEDEETFATTGYLTPLPPQNGVPGFSRVVMMKYFYLEDEVTVATDSLWAYEGLVLPGGKIMVGRWWAADAGNRATEMYSGPFIFWNVPDVPDVPEPRALEITGSAVADAILTQTDYEETSTEVSETVSNNVTNPDASSSDGDTISDEDSEDDTVEAEEEAHEQSLERFERYFSNPPADAFQTDIDLEFDFGSMPTSAKTPKTPMIPKTPTTPFFNMSLENTIDLTSTPEPLVYGSHNAFSLTSFKRKDSPFDGGVYTPPRPAPSPLLLPTIAPIDSNTDAIWAARPTNFSTTLPPPSFFSLNAHDQLGVSESLQSAGQMLESPYLNNKQLYDISTEKNPASDAEMSVEERRKYVGLLKDPWGYGRSVTTSKGSGTKAVRRR